LLFIEKASEFAANAKEAIVAGEKLAEEKLTATKDAITGWLS